MADADHMTRTDPDSTVFVLYPHRSLSPRGFLILMSMIGFVSFCVGLGFLLIGAWPVFGFFGLDVALIYLAFKLNYRSGREYEMLTVSPDVLELKRFHPSGSHETINLNPYWARVKLISGYPDGRNSLRLVAQGKEILFGQFLTDDERKDLADALTAALLDARGGARI